MRRRAPGPDLRRDTLARMLAAIRPEAVFATLAVDGEPTAYGMAVLERGMVGLFDIATHAAHRRRGHARRVTEALMAWGRRKGAMQAYLQVTRGQRRGAAALHRPRVPAALRLRLQGCAGRARRGGRERRKRRIGRQTCRRDARRRGVAGALNERPVRTAGGRSRRPSRRSLRPDGHEERHRIHGLPDQRRPRSDASGSRRAAALSSSNVAGGITSG